MSHEMLFALALGYLLGSIPFGLVLTRLAGKGDVRKIGSGNIGATNVLRTGSRLLAALTLILDCLKATAAILRLRDQPGFRDWPGGFRIFHTPLDRDGWTDGFISWDDT